MFDGDDRLFAIFDVSILVATVSSVFGDVVDVGRHRQVTWHMAWVGGPQFELPKFLSPSLREQTNVVIVGCLLSCFDTTFFCNDHFIDGINNCVVPVLVFVGIVVQVSFKIVESNFC